MLKAILSNTHSKEAYTIVIGCCVAFLCIVGLLSIYSVTSVGNVEAGLNPFSDLGQQLFYCILGIIICVIMMKIPQLFNVSSPLIWSFWGLCIAGIVAVAAFGTTVNGARRWLPLGPVTIQPSEFLKIALMLVMVKLLSEWMRGEKTSKETFIRVCATVGAPLLFLFITQKDLGTSAIAGLCLFALLYLACVDKKILLTIFVLGILGIVFFAMNANNFRSERFVFMDPWDDGQGGYGAGYNIIRSYYAIASGGVFGNGIGGSHEKYDYLYAADNDFIFAIICEEMGLVGALFVLACILTIFICCIKIASVQDQMENKLVLYGTGLLLIIQSLLNIGCTVGVLPTTGKPLPFVSSGGSSVIASFILLGVILNAVMHAQVETRADRKRSRISIYSKDDLSTSPDRSRRQRRDNDRPNSRDRQSRTRGSKRSGRRATSMRFERDRG